MAQRLCAATIILHIIITDNAAEVKRTSNSPVALLSTSLLASSVQRGSNRRRSNISGSARKHAKIGNYTEVRAVLLSRRDFVRLLYPLTLFMLVLTLPLRTAGQEAGEQSNSLLIRGGTVIDGTGTRGYRADIRIVGAKIAAIGSLTPEANERVIDASHFVVAPGFIDTHSHADGGLLDMPDAETQIRQGITTSVVGQDGGSHLPLQDWFAQVEAKHVAINIASFVGHGTVRNAVTGKDYKRHVTPEELAKMQALIEQEMQAGGLGLSTGLEYDPGFYSDTEELIACSKVVAKHGGMYISHVRDEGDKAIESFQELIRIGEEAGCPAQISHIKLDTSPSWNKATEVL